MTVSTRAPEVMTALVTALSARADLVGVQVTSGPMGPEAREKLEFWRIEGTQTWATFGQTPGRPTRDDAFTITGAAWASADGAGEDTITAARDRAYAIFKVLSDYIRENPSLEDNLVLWGHLTGGTLDQGFTDRKRWAQVAFKVEVKARI